MPEINGQFTRPGDRRTNDYYAAVGMMVPPFTFSNSGGAMSSQIIYGIGVYLYAGETVTNIVCLVTTAAAGTAPTALKLGLWDSGTPTCVASTADLSADARWTSVGWKANALSSPYVVPSEGLYYASFWINGTFSVTNLQLLGANTVGPLSSQLGSFKRPTASLKTAATTHAVSDTGTYGAGITLPFLAVS